jgi:hypothetical protein
MVVNVVIVNRSTYVADDDVRAVTEVLQTQVSTHFAPVWGRSANLRFVPMGSPMDMDAWVLTLVDYTGPDSEGEPRSGNVTTRGLPVGKVRVHRDGDRHDWTLAASHELLELLADPHGTLTACRGQLPDMSLYALNVCDPCAARMFSYEIDGVMVSDFVWPTWFAEPFGCVHAPIRFDQQCKIRQPFQLLDGGYAAVVSSVASERARWKRLSASGEEHEIDQFDRLGQRVQREALRPDDGVWCFGRVLLESCPEGGNAY